MDHEQDQKNTESFACFWTLSPQTETEREGAGIAQWLECQIHVQKVPGLSPHRSCRIIFFSRVSTICWVLFWYPSHPRVTTVTCKRSQSFCQTHRWQVTAKLTCTAYTCGFIWHDTINQCMVDRLYCASRLVHGSVVTSLLSVILIALMERMKTKSMTIQGSFLKDDKLQIPRRNGVLCLGIDCLCSQSVSRTCHLSFSSKTNRAQTTNKFTL